jgi:hypothetical protein
MRDMQLLRKFHRVLLNLYPKGYREEYGEELHIVFNLLLDDAFNKGKGELAGTILRELLGLPKAIIHEHLREWRKAQMTGKFASHFDFAPGSRNEALAALAPFLLGGALPTLFSFIGSSIDIPLWIQIVFTLFMWFLVGSLLVLGFKKRAPRWFMPYLGVPLPVICLIAFNALVNPEWRGFPLLDNASWFVKQFVHQGILWGWLLLSIFLIFLLARMIPRMQHFYHRLRTDWTLLPFILFGAMPLVIVFSFEEFRNEEPYLLLSFLVLALGAWFYLRNSSSWNKFWSLLIGLTLAMSIAVIGQTLLYESSFPFTTFPRWTTTLSTVIMWIWMVLYMFGSAALNLLQHSNEPFSSSG